MRSIFSEWFSIWRPPLVVSAPYDKKIEFHTVREHETA